MAQNDDFDKILQRYLDGTCTAQEKRLVDDWFLSLGKEDLFDLDTPHREALKQRLWSKLDAGTEARKIRRIGYRYAGRIAAAMAVIAVSLFLIFRDIPENSRSGPAAAGGQMVSVTNNEAVPREVVLSDGSSVLLEPHSELRFPEVFADKREIYLTGEAFFDVAKDAGHPFFVYTNEVTTRVLGTSFRIKAYRQEKEIVVAVKTGRVSVVTHAGREASAEGETPNEIILRPNQQVVYNRNEDKVSATLVDEPEIVVQQPSLKMSYVDTPVAEILEALEESYGVDIRFSKGALAGCTLTTEMTEEGLYERIEIICNALDASYRVADTVIVVESDGCQ